MTQSGVSNGMSVNVTHVVSKVVFHSLGERTETVQPGITLRKNRG